MSYYSKNREKCKQKSLDYYYKNQEMLNEKHEIYFREVYYQNPINWANINRKNIITKKYGLEYYKILKKHLD